MQNHWTSIHVYFHGNMDRLINDCLSPLVLRLEQDREIDRFFFLRYWKQGPHLRVRFRSPEVCALDLSEHVVGSIESYLEENPCKLELKAEVLESALAMFGEDEHVGPATFIQDNSVAVETYEPELAKYGGDTGIEVAEKLFDDSSRVCLQIMPEITNGLSRPGIALAMIIYAIRGFGLAARPDDFLSFHQLFWRRYTSDDSRQQWEVEFSGRSSRLQKLVLDTRNVDSDSSSLFTTWEKAVRTARDSIEKNWSVLRDQLKGTTPIQKKMRLLSQYIHTHNNRLGIRIDQESYLAFLLSRTYQSID